MQIQSVALLLLETIDLKLVFQSLDWNLDLVSLKPKDSRPRGWAGTFIICLILGTGH